MNNAIVRLFLAVLVVAAGLAHANDPTPRPLRVLFIGSSLTYTNGLPNRFRMLATQYEDRPVEVAEATLAASGLRRHWDGRARTRIQDGGWDYVVLQQGFDVVITSEYPKLFDDEIQKVGAKSILLVTWALRGDKARQKVLNDAFAGVARELRMKAAPVGPAWELAETKLPGIGLYQPDDLHPSHAGTYLAACVIYSTIFDKPLPTEGTEGSTKVSHEAAWEAVQAWRVSRP